MLLFAQARNAHRTLALPEKLDEDRPKRPEGLLLLLHVHGTTSIEDRVEAREIVVGPGRALRQHVHHRRGQEHGGHAIALNGLEDPRRIERPRGGKRAGRAPGQVVEDRAARPMRDGRGVEQDIRRHGRVDVEQEQLDHREQSPLGQHRALGPPGRARRIEQPRQVVRLDNHLRRCLWLALQERVKAQVAGGIADTDAMLDRREAPADRIQMRAERFPVDQDAGARSHSACTRAPPGAAGCSSAPRPCRLSWAPGWSRALGSSSGAACRCGRQPSPPAGKGVGEAVDPRLRLTKRDDLLVLQPRRALRPTQGRSREEMADVHTILQ